MWYQSSMRNRNIGKLGESHWHRDNVSFITHVLMKGWSSACRTAASAILTYTILICPLVLNVISRIFFLVVIKYGVICFLHSNKLPSFKLDAVHEWNRNGFLYISQSLNDEQNKSPVSASGKKVHRVWVDLFVMTHQQQQSTAYRLCHWFKLLKHQFQE